MLILGHNPLYLLRTLSLLLHKARAAGYENIKRGEPGYAAKLDRDKDGVACESK